WANNQHVYFAIEFSEEISDYFLIDDTVFLKNNKKITSRFARAYFKFDLETENQILLKTGLSPSNIEGALKNLNSEVPDWDFESVKTSASDIWEKELAKIQVESSDISKKETFYTAVYHSYIAPTLFSDVDGTWRGIDREVHKKNGFTNYTVFSLWDTFRALHPLLTITQKNLVNDLIKAMLVHYEESGQLPIWTLEGCETNCMIGYHSIPVIVDAYFKGIGDFDVELAYEAMKASAERDFRGLKAFAEFGYVPADLENESVSKALEYCYDDWCIAQMAKALGKEEDYQRFTKRAGFYRNHFDLKTGFMRGKNSDGKWKEGFNPLYSNHREDEYTEGNAWQYSWFVPHDVYGLIELHRGADNFIAKLDSLFEQNTSVEGENSSADISGLIGQYAHGNEPSHHVAYLYNYAGKPWKTQERVNEILSTLYSNTPDGISGNDDCGQMSAWYVLSSIGFYPVNAADGNFIFGRPIFDKVIIDLENEKKFIVIAENVSDENMYIQSVTLNGNPYKNSYITYKSIMNGGELRFVMSDTPNKKWGSSMEME
ncbi:GH92 family glycosyl hydrolase, partial [Bacteroidota bacterium]